MLFVDPASAKSWAGKLFLIPFFCFHYGMFTFVHGVFVVVLFSGYRGHGFPNPLQILLENGLALAVLAIGVSHGISFATNYLRDGEYRRATINDLFHQPYGRVVVLHLAIIAGGALMMKMRSPAAGLLVLVALKIVLDLGAHLAERRKFAGEE
jgi:hypothetical protein